jgi:hypothetical protein
LPSLVAAPHTVHTIRSLAVDGNASAWNNVVLTLKTAFDNTRPYVVDAELVYFQCWESLVLGIANELARVQLGASQELAARSMLTVIQHALDGSVGVLGWLPCLAYKDVNGRIMPGILHLAQDDGGTLPLQAMLACLTDVGAISPLLVPSAEVVVPFVYNKTRHSLIYKTGSTAVNPTKLLVAYSVFKE